MKATHLTSPPPGNERALLVGLETPDNNKWDHAESLQELGELVKSAGGEVVETAIQRRPSRIAATYIGQGKADELAKLCHEKNIGTVIFNNELSPAQSRNLEKIFNRKILDRTQLILDIRAAGEVKGRQAADRIGAAPISVATADRNVDPSLAPERRNRDAGSR